VIDEKGYIRINRRDPVPRAKAGLKSATVGTVKAMEI
jgi:hypothetical protein